MDIAWNKLIMWIIAILVAAVIIVFMIQNLKPDGTGIIHLFFNTTKTVGSTTP